MTSSNADLDPNGSWITTVPKIHLDSSGELDNAARNLKEKAAADEKQAATDKVIADATGN